MINKKCKCGNNKDSRAKNCRSCCDKLKKGILPKNFEKNLIVNQFKKGHEVPEEWKDKISKKNKGHKFNWKGGKHSHQGYVMIYCSEHPRTKRKYVFEHILVVEKFIGRYLKKGEIIHHINGIKNDNRIENLMIFNSDAEHLGFHAKVRQFGMTTPVIMQIKNRWDEYL